jgi:hypothetical protein
MPDQARITEKKLIQLQTIKVITIGITNLAITISLIKNPPKPIFQNGAILVQSPFPFNPLRQLIGS